MSLILIRDLTTDRHGTPGPDVHAMLEQTDRLLQIRDKTPAEGAEFADAIRSIVSFQRNDGSFSYLSSYDVPSDARVDFVYHPTYTCCQILIKALLAGNANVDILPALKRGLEFSCGRRLLGHGFEDVQDQVRVVQTFADAGIATLLDQQPALCPEFSTMLTEIIDGYVKRVEDCDTFLPHGGNITVEMMHVVEAFREYVTVPVFVYGTLMAGERNHGIVEDCENLGAARVFWYTLHDLGPYPAIKPSEDFSFVQGEVVLCDADTLERVDKLEEEGILYNRVKVRAIIGNKPRAAYAYKYRSKVPEDSWVPEELQPWTRLRELKETHVWYVAYGSNLLRERFMCYIEGGYCEDNGRTYGGCSDTTPPLCDIPFTIPYDVYFGNRSSSWGGSGVAFLDTSHRGSAYGRAYLVTREQLEMIHEQEGSGANWYHDKLTIGSIADIPLVTLTNKSEREHVEPNDAYLNVIRKGLAENIETLSDEQIEAYLRQAAER